MVLHYPRNKKLVTSIITLHRFYMANKKYILTPLVLFILPFLIYAQTNPQSDNLTSRLNAYVKNMALEKTYLQTDRERYATGDTIW